MIGYRSQWQIEQDEKIGAYMNGLRDATFTRYDRIAEELAGDDHTLRRVLSARLRDAFREGELMDAKRFAYKLELHYSAD